MLFGCCVNVRVAYYGVLLARAEPVAFFGEGQAAPFFYGDGLAAPCGHVWTPSLLVMLLQRSPALRSLAVDGCRTLAPGTPASPARPPGNPPIQPWPQALHRNIGMQLLGRNPTLTLPCGSAICRVPAKEAEAVGGLPLTQKLAGCPGTVLRAALFVTA